MIWDNERALDELEDRGFTILDFDNQMDEYGSLEKDQGQSEAEYLGYLDSIAPDRETLDER